MFRHNRAPHFEVRNCHEGNRSSVLSRQAGNVMLLMVKPKEFVSRTPSTPVCGECRSFRSTNGGRSPRLLSHSR